ncbi:MAG: polysaccharide deacetylase family protein, partial [Dehalococcoidia bacterium]|nr:polysaccharide deacetylase family protein [Dehalococcoidia bacterium]
PVMITLDDGFEDNFYGAYPVLEGLGLQATIFLVAGLVGQAAFWNSSYGPPAKLLSWEEVSAMAQGPITFGAHTITHPHLCGLSPVRAREEIAGAKTILEDRMGREVSFFSYPFSDFSPMLRDYVAEAGYQAACSSILGYSDGSDDIYALRRVIVGGGDSLEAFAKKVRGRSTGRETLRTALRKVKRAVLQMRLRCNSGERNVAGCLLDKRRKDSAQGLISASKGGLPCRRRDTWT